MHTIARALTAVAIAALVGSCSLVGSIPSLTPTGPLLNIYYHGGLCPDGMECHSTTTIERDGRVQTSSKPPNDLGTVPADKLKDLESAINMANFAALKSHPFTGTCPTSYDGQEVTYQFATPGGFEAIASCSVDIDTSSPLFVAVSAALSSYQ